MKRQNLAEREIREWKKFKMGEDGGGGKETAEKKWVEDLQKTVVDSKNSAILSARTLQQNSSSFLRSLQQQKDAVPKAISQLNSYQDAFFAKAKEHLKTGIEHPSEAIGVGLVAVLLLMRGPRRFLFRHTFGRFQSEEARFLKAERSVKELDSSVNLMKMETKKLLQRAALAESDMKHGLTDLMGAGSQIQQFAKSTFKLENQATDLMDGLREVPGREALKLRAEVASMASLLKRRKNELNKRIMKISDLGVPV